MLIDLGGVSQKSGPAHNVHTLMGTVFVANSLSVRPETIYGRGMKGPLILSQLSAGKRVETMGKCR